MDINKNNENNDINKKNDNEISIIRLNIRYFTVPIIIYINLFMESFYINHLTIMILIYEHF